ncbi:MAG: DEAD/DEAH box helicase, partial [Chloroflexia bacterium]|nr:DEAD/DEAH box helicase [Chloroflexia bacterium]
LLFEEKEIVGYLDSMVEVNKSIYDAIRVDSAIESRFATDLNLREDIRLFLKLPDWFTVETPVGTYNPDWAIVKQHESGGDKLYLVSETKGTMDQLELRGSESAKIACGRAHFGVLDVTYRQVTSVADL